MSEQVDTRPMPAVEGNPGPRHSVRQRHTSRHALVRDGLLAALAVAGAALALVSASGVAMPIASDYGLVATLPPTYWAGLLAVNVAFALSLTGGKRGHRVNPWLMALLTATLIATLFSVAAMVTDHPRGEVAWRHIGIADALQRTGTVNPDIDAYFNWPGFFALLALVTKATGLGPLALALWAPVVNVALWTVALAAVVRTLTKDPRRLWLTLWLFCLGNWQDQDYLSPQAFAFFLYLVVLALVLGPLRAHVPRLTARVLTAPLAWWRARGPAEPDPARRVAALGACLLLVVVISGSHQLTPFMLVMALVALTLSGRLWAPGLLVLSLVVVGIWLAYPASAYLVGHPPLGDIGLSGAATANVAERVGGSPGHVMVVRLRMGLAALFWVAAAVGVLVDRRRGRLDVRPVLLMVAPFVLLPFQSYGGEMLIRVSLFALPFAAYLAAGALPAGRPRARTAAVVLTCALLAPLVVTGRYGNARFDMFTDNEVVAAQELYKLAPPEAAIISGAHPTPWRHRGYLDHKYRTVRDLCSANHEPNACGQAVYAYARHNPGGALVLLNRASKASMVLQGVLTAGSYDEFEQWLGHVDSIHLVYENSDARIYRIDPPR